jgi:hypothetical protein
MKRVDGRRICRIKGFHDSVYSPPKILVLEAYYGHVLYLWVLTDDRFDFGRKDVRAAGDDEVGAPIGEV